MTVVFKNKISAHQLSIFCRQLSTLLSAGVSLTQGLTLLSTITNTSLQKWLIFLKTRIEEGESFSQALQQNSLYVDSFFLTLIATGEKSGTLDSMLIQIAIYKEKAAALERKIKKAAFYPTLVAFITLSIFIFFSFFTIPQFEQLFTNFNATLPPFTQQLIHFSRFLQENKIWLVGVLLGSFLFLRHTYFHSPSLQQQWDSVLLRLPVIGNILKKYALIQLAQALAVTLNAGISLVEALTLLAPLSSNKIYSKATLDISKKVCLGFSLSTALAENTLFPPFFIQMTLIGEDTGALPQMLTLGAQLLESEIEHTLDNLTQLIEPLMMLALGLLVGAMLIALYLPIFKINFLL